MRKYIQTPLADDLLQLVVDYSGTLEPMLEGITVEIKVVPGRMVKNMFPVKAPFYFLLFSENKEGFMINAGFMLQQLDLYLSANGIGTCWMGIAKPAKEIAADSNLDFVTALAFGMPRESLYRQNISQFKRKPLEAITNIAGMEELLETTRLAPSATNSQPWYFTESEGYVHAYCVKPVFIKKFFHARLNIIDMGIAICHFCIAARQFGKEVKIADNEKARANPPTGFYYITSIKLS